ncbi:MAG TPA: hypothetical protein VK445_10405, partial [Dissulfurispiraceae bacterium]|nr:hypothetical protein [Dissulfurispiraceae bacterium]
MIEQILHWVGSSFLGRYLGIILVVLMLLTPIAIYKYVKFAIRVSKKSWTEHKSRLRTGLIIAVFVLIPTWDNIAGNVALFYLCETEGGLRINKTIDGEEGFLLDEIDGCGIICAEELFAGRYRFVEVNVVRPNKNHFTDEIGLYRFSLAKKGSPECRLYDAQYAKLMFVRDYPKDLCIASERIQSLKSHYTYRCFDKEL